MMKIKCFTIRNFRPTEVASYKNKIKSKTIELNHALIKTSS